MFLTAFYAINLSLLPVRDIDNNLWGGRYSFMQIAIQSAAEAQNAKCIMHLGP